MAASVDTLDGFLREMKTRFPDATASATAAAGNAEGRSNPTGSLPQIVGLKRADAQDSGQAQLDALSDSEALSTEAWSKLCSLPC